MKRLRDLVIQLLATATLAACSYNGAIKQDFYHPTSESGTLPINAAIIADDTVRSQRLTFKTAVAGDVEIALNPALLNAIGAQLRQIFQHVSVVDGSSQVGDADIAVIPATEVSFDRPVTLRLTAVNTRSWSHVAEYQASRIIDWHRMDDSAELAAFFTGFTLGIDSFLLPIANDDIGRTTLKQVETALAADLSDISAQMRNDQQRLSSVSAKAPLPAPADTDLPKSPTPQPQDSLPSVTTPHSNTPKKPPEEEWGSGIGRGGL